MVMDASIEPYGSLNLTILPDSGDFLNCGCVDTLVIGAHKAMVSIKAVPWLSSPPICVCAVTFASWPTENIMLF